MKPFERIADEYDTAIFLKLYGNANVQCKRLFQRLKIRRRADGRVVVGGAGRVAGVARPARRVCMRFVCAGVVCLLRARRAPATAVNHQRKLGAQILKYSNPNLETAPQHEQTNSTPAFVLFRGGEVVGSGSGANKARLETLVRSHLTPEELAGTSRIYEEETAAA